MLVRFNTQCTFRVCGSTYFRKLLSFSEKNFRGSKLLWILILFVFVIIFDCSVVISVYNQNTSKHYLNRKLMTHQRKSVGKNVSNLSQILKVFSPSSSFNIIYRNCVHIKKYVNNFSQYKESSGITYSYNFIPYIKVLKNNIQGSSQ